MLAKLLRTTIFVTLLGLLSAPAHAGQRLDFAGGWYSYACTTGERATLVKDQRIDTHVGAVPLPAGQNALYLVLPCDGSGRIAAVGGRDDHAYEWSGGRWNDRGIAFGVNPLIYDNQNVLQVVRAPGGPTGSQGWRYVDDNGELVTGDASFADHARHLWERTCLGNVCCGQGGDEEGLQCLIRGRRVLVSEGIIRNVRLERAGFALALAWVRFDTNSAGVWQFTEAELDALPTYTLPVDPVDPIDPIDPPVVECGEIPLAGQQALSKLWARPDVNVLVRSANDDDRRKSALMFAEQLAFTVGPQWGTKNAGSGRPQSKDAVARFVDGTLCGWDIVNGTTRELSFGHGEPIPGQEFIPVFATNHLGGVIDPPPTDDIKKLKARVVELEAAVEEVTKQRNAMQITLEQAGAEVTRLNAEIATLSTEIERLKSLPEPTCRVSGPGWVRSLFGISCQVVRQ